MVNWFRFEITHSDTRALSEWLPGALRAGFLAAVIFCWGNAFAQANSNVELPGQSSFDAYADGTQYPAKAAQRTKEFSNYKFGMFIHWGLYSSRAGRWTDGRVMNGPYSEWIMYDLDLPFQEYAELVNDFNPTGFNAEEWMQLASDIGMNYVVITAKHHDGFALYDSNVSEFDIAATPFNRDPLRELKDAADRHDIAMGFYYSQAQDWSDVNGGVYKALTGKIQTFHPQLSDDHLPNFDRYIIEKSIRAEIVLV